MKLLLFNKILTRLLVRYMPAAGTLWLTKFITEKYTVDEYAFFALLVSLSALVPILDFGGGTKAVLVKGDPKKVSQLLFLPIFISIGLGLLWLLAKTDLLFAVFLLSLPVPIYVIARGCYAIDGADIFNKRALRLYLLGLGFIIFNLQLDVRWAIYITPLFVVYFILVAGLKLSYLRIVGRFFINGRWTYLVPDRENLKIIVLAAFAFIGVWSNVTYLSLFGTAIDVKAYDLIWRMLSVTFFAQLYLSHSLPEVVHKITTKERGANARILLHHSIIAAVLTIVQLVVVVLIFPAYAKYFNFSFQWSDVIAGIFMCAVFGMIIPINQILLGNRLYKIQFYLFGGSAFLSVLLKLFIPPSAQIAFYTAGIGYLMALVGGLFVVIKMLGEK